MLNKVHKASIYLWFAFPYSSGWPWCWNKAATFIRYFPMSDCELCEDLVIVNPIKKNWIFFSNQLFHCWWCVDNLFHCTQIYHPTSFRVRFEWELWWLTDDEKSTQTGLYYLIVVQEHYCHQVLKQCLLVEPADWLFDWWYDEMLVAKAFQATMKL